MYLINIFNPITLFVLGALGLLLWLNCPASVLAVLRHAVIAILKLGAAHIKISPLNVWFPPLIVESESHSQHNCSTHCWTMACCHLAGWLMGGYPLPYVSTEPTIGRSLDSHFKFLQVLPKVSLYYVIVTTSCCPLLNVISFIGE